MWRPSSVYVPGNAHTRIFDPPTDRPGAPTDSPSNTVPSSRTRIAAWVTGISLWLPRGLPKSRLRFTEIRLQKSADVRSGTGPAFVIRRVRIVALPGRSRQRLSRLMNRRLRIHFNPAAYARSATPLVEANLGWHFPESLPTKVGIYHQPGPVSPVRPADPVPGSCRQPGPAAGGRRTGRRGQRCRGWWPDAPARCARPAR